MSQILLQALESLRTWSAITEQDALNKLGTFYKTVPSKVYGRLTDDFLTPFGTYLGYIQSRHQGLSSLLSLCQNSDFLVINGRGIEFRVGDTWERIEQDIQALNNGSQVLTNDVLGSYLVDCKAFNSFLLLPNHIYHLGGGSNIFNIISLEDYPLPPLVDKSGNIFERPSNVEADTSLGIFVMDALVFYVTEVFYDLYVTADLSSWGGALEQMWSGYVKPTETIIYDYLTVNFAPSVYWATWHDVSYVTVESFALGHKIHSGVDFASVVLAGTVSGMKGYQLIQVYVSIFFPQYEWAFVGYEWLFGEGYNPIDLIDFLDLLDNPTLRQLISGMDVPGRHNTLMLFGGLDDYNSGRILNISGTNSDNLEIFTRHFTRLVTDYPDIKPLLETVDERTLRAILQNGDAIHVSTLQRFAAEFGGDAARELNRLPEITVQQIATNPEIADFVLDNWKYSGQAKYYRGNVPTSIPSEQVSSPTGKNANILIARMHDANNDIIPTGSARLQSEEWTWASRLPTQEEQAHHIVPALAENSEAARLILAEYGIVPNSAWNGIGIPEHMHVGRGSQLHSPDYVKAVTNALQSVKDHGGTPADMTAMLDEIAFIIDRRTAGATEEQVPEVMATIIKEIQDLAE